MQRRVWRLGREMEQQRTSTEWYQKASEARKSPPRGMKRERRAKHGEGNGKPRGEAEQVLEAAHPCARLLHPCLPRIALAVTPLAPLRQARHPRVDPYPAGHARVDPCAYPTRHTKVDPCPHQVRLVFRVRIAGRTKEERRGENGDRNGDLSQNGLVALFW